MIILLILAAFSSSVLQVLLSGIRVKLCGVFYPDRVRERADYLYFELITGRMKRRCELLMLVRREVERQEKLVQFSSFYWFREVIYSVLRRRRTKLSCPGCNRENNLTEMRDLPLDMVGRSIRTMICVDCELDLASKYKYKL